MATHSLAAKAADETDAAMANFQEATSGNMSASDSRVLEEIIVTAQRTAENLQSVPVAVTAITSDSLRRWQMVNIEDIKYVVPNLYLEQNLSNASTSKIFMRGIGQSNSAFSFDSPVGMYVDDVYYARSVGSLIDFFDVDRIEVLRGPQGTIYGRNASIGAIRVVTKSAPLNDFDFMADATGGSKKRFDGRAAVGIPIIEDKLGVRFAFITRNNDGFQKNIVNDEDADTKSLNALRGQLLFQPNDDVSFTLRGDYLRDRSRPKMASHFINDPDNDPFTFESNRSFNAGTNQSELDSYGASFTVDWDFGNTELKSITAWRDVDTHVKFDTDGTTRPSFEVDASFLSETQFTQEVFFTGSDVAGLPIDWVGGVFYLHEKNDYVWSLQIFAPPTTQYFKQSVDSTAGYIQGTYHINEQWDITGGLRYTDEAKDFDALGLLADGSSDFSFSDHNGSTSKWTWRAAINYEMNEDVLLYASAATGFRSGGLNGNAQSLPEVTGGAFAPEETTMYEFGLKSDWFNKHLRFNASYYFGEYDDLQLAIVRDDGVVSNTNNSAQVHGLELEVTALPFQDLELTGTLGTLSQNVDNSTRELPNAPGLNWDISALYSHMLSKAMLEFGGSYSWVDSSYLDAGNSPLLEVMSHESVDAHISLIPDGSHWEFTLAGHNLTDEEYAVGGFYIAGGFLAAVKYPSTPRNWSITASYRY
jgi:iron complex outermembrane receptor protein